MATSQVMRIKICEVVDPRTFWAHEVQKMTRSLVKLRGMESKLQEAMRLMPAKITRTAPVGTMVAVFYQSRWVRGRLVQLYLDKYLLATVFLIDYGETVDRINVATNVRKLDNYFLKEPGGAFQVVLSGLSPITMDMDWSLEGTKMSVSPTSDWDTSAISFVKGIIGENNGEAELVDYVVDNRGRRHGQVLVLASGSGLAKLHLNELLIEHKFAEHSRWQFENDLMDNDVHVNALPAIVEEEHDAEDVWDEPTVELNMSLEQFSQESDLNNNVARSSFIADTSVISSNRNINKSHRGRRASSVHPSSTHIGSPLTHLNPDASFSEVKSFSKNGTSERLLTVLRRNSKVLCISKEVKKKKEEEPDMWAVLRNSGDSSRDDTRRNVLIPGGVFVGKFHESVVSHCNEGSSSGRELKERFEEFVTKKKRDDF